MTSHDTQGGEGTTLHVTQGEGTSFPAGDVDPRTCEKVKDDGSRCRGWKVGGERYCAGHLGLGIAASPEAARAAQQQGAQRRSEKAEEARKRPIEVYRDGLVRDAGEFYRIRLAIARDTTAADGDRLRAMEQLENRALGRPTEHVEVESKTPASVAEIQAMSREERHRLLAELQQRRLRAVGDDEH